LAGIPRGRRRCGRQDVVISLPQQHISRGKRQTSGHCGPTRDVPALAAAVKYMANQASALMHKAQPAIFCEADQEQADTPEFRLLALQIGWWCCLCTTFSSIICRFFDLDGP